MVYINHQEVVFTSHPSIILSFETEKIPSEIKNARITLLFKKISNRFDVGNYRLVSILSITSKIVEKAVNNELKGYLDRNSLLYQYQSGFRGAYSTYTCLI